MRNKLLTLFLVSTIIFLAYTQVGAQDILSGKYTIQSNYLTEQEKLETLSILNINFDKSNMKTAYHLDLDYNVNLNNFKRDIKLNEAFFDYYGTDYDLRFGQQIINWGSALEYNPTSNLNPLEEIGLMGDSKPIFMVNGQYYIDRQYSIQGVVIPYHVPTVKRLYLSQINDTVSATQLENNLNNMEYAFKWLARGVNGFDFSVSYFNGHEDLPTIGIKQTPMGPQPDLENIFYREVNIYGADIATSYKGTGLWAEAAYISPKNGDDYSSAVIGADYRLENGVYLQGQLMYLKDKLSNENTIIQTAIENTFNKIHDFRVAAVYNTDTDGYLIRPEVVFSLANATDLTIGYEYYGGQLLNNQMLTGSLGENKLNIELSYSF